MRPLHLPLALTIAALLASPASGAEKVDYARDVKPLLHEKCYACHGALKQKSGLRLDTGALILQGTDNGPAVVPGKPDESRLIHAVTGTHEMEKMPRDGAPLTDKQISLVRAWIEQGAAAPQEPVPPDPREHWSFKPATRPAVPTASDATWVRNPIDAFVAAEHEKRGLARRLEAPKHVLLRRLYLDLVGIPPTRAQLKAFLADESTDAYEKFVDELLASPLYGQRWGRHWMDVWRYSDWAGYGAEVRDSQQHIWRWRDWIVESLNADKPYDRMVVEMLAGDEVAPTDPDTVRATGYLARSWYKFNRNVWMDNTVEHAAKAFLGLTLNCARCHDHKYDPLDQKEYYQFRAFFEPTNVRTDPVPGGGPDGKKDGLARIFDEKADAQTFLFIRGDEKAPDKEKPLAPAVPAVLGGELDVKPVELPAEAYYPGLRKFAHDEALAAARADVEKAKAAVDKEAAAARAAADAAEAATTAPTTQPDPLAAELAHLKAGLAASNARRYLPAAEAQLAAVEARIAADKARYATPPAPNAGALASAAAHAERVATFLKAEAELASAESAAMASARKPRDPKAKKELEEREKLLAEKQKAFEKARGELFKPTSDDYSPFGKVYPKASTGRRLALARWITRRDNPLAARVAVNHIWLRHFGEPLVPTVFDFGLNGRPPTHPQLLDWLSVELVDRGWRMKDLHRLIVTSATYRMASSEGPEELASKNRAIDPDNRYLWRAPVRRLEAEAVRDSVLHAAGKLDVAAGGPELDQASALTSPRRSLYFRHAHEKQAVFLQLFDAASPNECYRRQHSVVPQQALALANSPLALSHARSLAGELTKEVGAGAEEDTESAFVNAAYEQVLSRPPLNDEREACVRFLSEQTKLLADPKKLEAFAAGDGAAVKPSSDPHQRARENLVHVLMNHNDFVTVR